MAKHRAWRFLLFSLLTHLVTAAATNAQTGSISGTVTDADTGVGIPFKEVRISDAAGRSVAATSGSGDYTVTGLAPGVYFAFVWAEKHWTEPRNYHNEVFDDLPCQDPFGTSAEHGCPLGAGKPIRVTAGSTTTGIDFAVSPQGLVTGTIFDALTHAPLGGWVRIYAGPGHALSPGTLVKRQLTDSSGTYWVSLAPGRYYVVTGGGGYPEEAWPDVPCPYGKCGDRVTFGTLISVTAGAITGGIDFALTPPGQVSGRVILEDSGSNSVVVRVDFYDTTGTRVSSPTAEPETGAYSIWLPPGTYYARTHGYGRWWDPWRYVDVLYDGTPCVACDVLTGTPIVVTSGGQTRGIDFVVPLGGSITGIVTDASTAHELPAVIRIYTSTGDLYKTVPTDEGRGTFWAAGLASGVYYARAALADDTFHIGELWDNFECFLECPVTAGTPIVVTAGTTRRGVDFALNRGATIAGRVTTDSGAGLIGVPVLAFPAAGGGAVKRVATDYAGGYQVRGLPRGTYFLRTSASESQYRYSPNFVDEAYGGSSCVPCNVAESTPVVLTSGEVRTGADFVLSRGGALTGLVTDAETGRALTSGVAVFVYTATGAVARTARLTNAQVSVDGLPEGMYFVSASATAPDGAPYLDELYDDRPCLGCVPPTDPVPAVVLPCPSPCTPAVALGTPVLIALDRIRPGVDFVLSPGGGTINGSVTEASTGTGLGGVQVLVYTASNTLVKSAVTDQDSGAYRIGGLAPGTYYARTVVSEATPHVVDEAFGGTPCAPCTVVSASVPIVVAAGTVAENIDFRLMSAGSFAGTVTGAVTVAAPGVAVRGVLVQAFTATGEFVKGVFANGLGVYHLGGLRAGTYYARTSAGPSGPTYVDELYHDRRCTISSCPVTSGTPITVSLGVTTTGIDFSLDRSLISNGGFTTGLSPGWFEYATPDTSHIVSTVEQGIYQFYRVPTAGGTNQAVVFQPTGAAVGAFEQLVAEFQLGNSSTARKRMTVLVHDSDFSDRSACTFWLEPGSPLGTYGMLAYTNHAWTNATISFYAATPNSDGGYYRIDNVSLQRAPLEPTTSTACIDPTAPAPGVIHLAAQLVDGSLRTNAPRPSLQTSAARSIREMPPAPFTAGVRMNDGVAPSANGAAWETPANATRGAALSWGNAIDLRGATTARLTFMSWLSAPSQVFVEVRMNGSEWLPVSLVPASEAWRSLDVDLTPYVGSLIEVRFVLVAQDRLERSTAGVWSLEDLRVDVDAIR